jgi:NifU-like protein involved in Fe-S cluster formation
VVENPACGDTIKSDIRVKIPKKNVAMIKKAKFTPETVGWKSVMASNSLVC